MPFPPTFTNVWDITQPPDTQVANLLGQDLRNLKNDVMQRLSLLSGTLANRPTPEIVNATWGGAGFGVLYFSTDNGKLYQWNGAAWVDVTSNFFVPPLTRNIFTGGIVTAPNDNNNNVIYTGTVGAGILGTTGGLRVEATWSTVGSVDTATFSVVLGGVVIASQSFFTSTQLRYLVTLINTAANAQIVTWAIIQQSGIVTVTVQNAFAIDTTVNQTLTVNVQKNTSTDPIKFYNGFATLL